MFVKSLEIVNFRNYRRQHLTLSPGVNVFSGDNGQGKTNLLEAVYFASIGKSTRTSRDKELILWDEERAKVTVTVEKSFGDETAELIISRGENKRVAVNGMPVTRLGELMGVVGTVFFSPSELKIVQAGPGERRSFIDIAVCQLSKAYFYLLLRYNKILAQRNRLLKSGHATSDALDIWDAQLAAVGAKVVKTRRGFVRNLAPYACENHLFLSGGAEDLALFYEGIGGETAEETERAMLCELKKERERDLKLGFTHSGPHKDDLILKIGAADIRSYGSQGQQRTAALSLKLSELQLATATRGECPVLLLDDVLSELDVGRQQKLLERIQGFQTLLTCTHLEPGVRARLGGGLTEFRVERGAAERAKISAT
ncbi:MAG: DNA replication/repair protein RecF [Firmicutes bacterium]|nr:DNA replication/repair protein RecF [Bacillota bacterium]